MEIRVKTYDEVREERVTIEVAPGQRAQIEIVGPSYDAEAAADALAGNYGRARQEIERLEAALAKATRGHVCTGECKPNAHVAFIGRQRLDELEREVADEAERADRAEAERDSARRRVAELERQLGNSIGRENKLEADAAEEKTLHRRALEARDSLLSAATTRINAVREILLARTVTEARDNIVTSKGAVLADAIGNALHALEG